MTGRSNLVYIAGNIAAGKTTTSQRLASVLAGRLVAEQTDTNPYLSEFYDDMTRWTFHTDVHFLAARAETVVREYEPGGAPVVFDRSWSEGAIFAAVAHRAGLASDDEWATFSSLFGVFERLLPRPAVTVYLRADPVLLFERVQRRGRAFESGITLEYLRSLQVAYDEWIAGESSVIVVDTGEVDLRDPSSLAALAEAVSMHWPKP